MPAIRAIDKLANILANSENFLQRMHELGQEPAASKQLQRLFSRWLPAIEELPEARKVRWSLDVDPTDLY